MSPRAAWRLERLGFERVHDYVPGKMDWLAAWLPWEGRALLAGQAVDGDVPTCTVDEDVGTVRRNLGDLVDGCVVVNDVGVVMGVLGHEAAHAPADASVEQVMSPGPTTIRPSEQLKPLTERMQAKDVQRVLATTADGTLLGAVRLETAVDLVKASG